MKTAVTGGVSAGSVRWRPTSMMLSVRVPLGTRSGRARRAGVFGNANDAPWMRPPPTTPNFPARAGSAKTAAAVSVALEPVADGDHRRCQRPVPLDELSDLALVHAADPRGVRHRVATRQRHVLLEAGHVTLDERAVEPSLAFQLGRHCPREHDVRPRAERDVEIGLLGDLCPPRVDDDELAAGATRAVDDRYEVEVRPRHVAAPGDDELRMLGLLGPDAGHRTERPDPRLGADASAERPAIEQARAEPVEEPEVHRTAGEHAVRSGIVERKDRLRAVGGDHGRESLVDDVERLRPRNALEAPFTLGTRAAQRRLEAPLAVDEAGIRLRDLGAEHPGRIGVRARAADRDDPLVLDRDGEAAGIGTIEGADP